MTTKKTPLNGSSQTNRNNFFHIGRLYLDSIPSDTRRGFPEPEQSSVGPVLIIASAIVMTILYFRKMAIAEKIGSRALRAEAKETLVCDLQDLTALLN